MYREDFSIPLPSIYGVESSGLAKQLDALGADANFVGALVVIEALNGARRLPERAELVTFDDCLSEQAGF